MHNFNPQYCEWDTTSTFLIFSDNVFGNFIYYSHLLPIACLLFLSGVLVWQSYKDPAVRTLLFISLAFTAWSLSDLVLWATANPSHTMFFWSIIIHFELLIYIGSLYFVYYFISKKPPSQRAELLIFIAYIPILLFAHTSYNLQGFDYTNCWREALEGKLLAYVYFMELVIAVWILAYGIYQMRSEVARHRTKEILLVTLGTVAFLTSFSLGNIIGTLEIDWELGQYGLFGVPVFVSLLTFLIIRYRSISTKLFMAQGLVGGIFVLIISILFVREIENVRIITSTTAILVLLLGYYLIKSVNQEIIQRRKVEELAGRLEKANARLKILDKMKSEFVSIASHQLRSPLTSIRGYASMLLEGSFGKIPAKVVDAVEHIQDSGRYMALSIEDYLNVSRIEAGNMRYEYSDFNLREEAEKLVEELRPMVLKKGLKLKSESACSSGCTVRADIGKTRQVIQNLIDNALKYAPKGSITVSTFDDKKKKTISIRISDTGVGMSAETIQDIFDKFIRARNANAINVTGTGLGLFVAKKMIEEMGGRIWAESEGEGKGSVFTMEFPLITKSGGGKKK